VSLSSAIPLPRSADNPAPETDRLRWALWRSPAGQPAWARPALLGIAAVAALLYARNIAEAGLAPFYSVAVKSMSVSWKAFFYGAFDPGATITIDKLAGSFLPQALSARIFGFHPWSLALPQVIEGVVSVLVMYRVVRRWAGPVPGLLAAGIFAATPIAASMFGHSMEDGALTMCLVLAADSWQRAVMEGRLRSLCWAGVWVGLGFQAKMLQAWMILPALVLGYLLAAPAGLGRRLWHLGVAGLVMLAVSLSWIALYTFTPAADRPYVDGSTNNSAIAMVFGYNGVERFGISFLGSVQAFGGGGGAPRAATAPAGPAEPVSAPTATAAPAGTPSATTPDDLGGAPTATTPGGVRYNAGGFLGSSGSWTKLIGSRFGPEIGWLYPLALLVLIAGLAWRGRARRTDPLRAGLVMWGLWLITFGVIYSDMGNIPHTAYVASLAPPLAALSGTGIVLFWRWYRSGSRAWWLLSLAVAVEVAWAYYLWSGYRGFLPWLAPAAIVAGGIAIVVMAATRLSLVARLPRISRRGLVTAGVAAGAVGVAAMLAAPAAWSASVLDARYAGSSFDASAGPAGGFGPGGGGGFRAGRGDRPAEDFRRFREEGQAGGGGNFPGGGTTSPANGNTPGGGTSPGGDVPGGGAIPGGGSFPGGGSGGAPGGAGGGILGSTTTTLTSGQEALYRYLTAHRDGATYLFAVQGWTAAAPYILATGQQVLPMGGFSGSVPEPTLARVKQLVATGQLRYFMPGGAGGFGGGRGGADGSSETAQIVAWVQSACKTVPVSGAGSTGTLYQCGTA
jgi:4-amino-4-deoxy-L-arabinose transferase-like glycosyltransferase